MAERGEREKRGEKERNIRCVELGRDRKSKVDGDGGRM